ncbi:MAG: TrkH family potassium uptake protein [Cellulosilyticum sp.]|nr:Trk family potassium uptake protein [Cellulosilyticum sp.]MEE1071592.1 TrkH family potassium uptake protein [Cellulosilyticum sp.]
MMRDEMPGFVRKKRALGITESLNPAQILVGGFLILIVLASFLLMLPISSNSGEMTSFVNALFTATSAVCVTGLSVVNTLAYWSTFGKIVILCCIQIGGLGFMSLVSMIFIFLGRKITLRNRLVMQEALNFNTIAGVVRFTRMIVIGTLLVEGIGAILLAFVFIPEYGLKMGIGYAVFHSISAFCNAGFDLIGDSSLTPYVGNGIVNFVIMGLIIMGGLGFSVWVDTYKMFVSKIKAPKHYTWKQAIGKLSLHTKLVWVITSILLITGFMVIFLVEYNNPATLGALSFKEKIYAALFQSVSPRTAGFNTVSLADLTDTSKLYTIVLMFIGGSPAGTAGGIKTVTMGVLVLCAYNTIKGNENIIVFKRRITFDTVSRGLTIIMLAIAVIVAVVGILSLTEDFTFMEILFEAVSAFATVGTTLGITSKLSLIGKIVIIIVMFIGRLGPITMAVALMTRKRDQDKVNIQYPDEKIMVG